MFDRQVGKRYNCARLASEFRHARLSAWQTLQLCKAGIDRRDSTRLDMPVRQALEPSENEIRQFKICSRSADWSLSKSNESANSAPIHGANVKSRRQPITISSSFPRTIYGASLGQQRRQLSKATTSIAKVPASRGRRKSRGTLA
jgi:hypothetical protein